MKTIEEAVLSGRKALVRIDANVPMENGQITDNYRLKIVAPTINFLIEHGAKVILISHLGRPKGAVVPELSLKPIYEELAKLLGTPITFAPDIFSEQTSSTVNSLQAGEILGLENIRFDKGEEENSAEFAKKLAEYGDIYVNDAFSVSHREAATVVAITQFLPSYAGLLMEKEYKILGDLLRHPAKPFVVIIGGAKIEDKLPVIAKLINIADRILVGGGVANTFLSSQGMDVKKSLVDQEFLDKARDLLKRSAGKIILPTDFIYEDEMIIDLGSKTIAQFEQYIKSAKTVFWNGNLGKSELTKGAGASEAIARAMTESGATTIIAGGNTIELCNKIGVANKMSFASSGGGATLEFLSGETLPGIEALELSK